jgi:hypothetical protein
MEDTGKKILADGESSDRAGNSEWATSGDDAIPKSPQLGLMSLEARAETPLLFVSGSREYLNALHFSFLSSFLQRKPAKHHSMLEL